MVSKGCGGVVAKLEECGMVSNCNRFEIWGYRGLVVWCHLLALSLYSSLNM